MKTLLILAAAAPLAIAQSAARDVAPILGREIQSANVTALQLRQYAMKRVTPVRVPRDAGEWTGEARRIRRHLLDDVIFHGWPKEWVEAPLRVENAGIVESTQGYRAIKLRYEIIPGFYSTAILYEPLNVQGKAPAILNVNGHVGAIGKAAEYKQKRCINFAKRGIIALNLEWLGCGELDVAENRHSYAGHLDLAGANGVGLFYLAMRKGLDILERHPNADRSRLGVTGLSGGGWQTITLSALDERVAVAVPVAGYSSLEAGIEHPEYVGNDVEQNATDFRDGQDYAHLTAMRAPRPTLLIFNAEDECCFRSAMVKPGVFDAILPFFRLIGKEQALRYYENSDPGTHNYQLDNRQQAYRFFSEHFGLPAIEREIPVDQEIKSFAELQVGLPKDNLTILGAARKLAQAIPAAPDGPVRATSASERARLVKLIRYSPVSVKHAWPEDSTRTRGVESRSYLFEMSNGLCATGVWIKAIATSGNAPLTVVLNDAGRKSAAVEVSDYVNRGEQVLALDLLFTGDNTLPVRRVPQYTQLLATIGDRPVGIEAAQLIGIAGWLGRAAGPSRKRLHSTGIRSQVISLLAAATDPALFGEVTIGDGMRSLRWLLDAPVPYEAAPDLFCLDLLKEFDLPRLAALASPAKVTQAYLPDAAALRRGRAE